MRRRLALVAALCLAACADAPADASPDASRPGRSPAAPAWPHFEGDAPWTDDGASVPGFAAFRDSLRAVIARRDTAAFLAVVSPTARASFDDTETGPAAFRQMWFDGPPPDSLPVWDRLTMLLDGGTVAADGAVTAPSATALWPDSLDVFSYVVVPGPRVVARASPTDTTRVATLGRVYLAVDETVARDGWWHVRLPTGRRAVVAEAEAVSPVGYRATFWDDGDGWRLQHFLAGD